MGADSEDAAPIGKHYGIESNACSTPTLSLSFVVATIQLIPVWSSVLAVLLPNPAMCLHVGV